MSDTTGDLNDLAVATVRLKAFIDRPVASRAEVPRPKKVKPKRERWGLLARLTSLFTMLALGAFCVVLIALWSCSLYTIPSRYEAAARRIDGMPKRGTLSTETAKRAQARLRRVGR